MFTPEVTLRIIRWSTSKRPSCWTWGPKAVKRRVERCCADNLDCKRADECYHGYVRFVNATDNPKEPPEGGYQRRAPTPVETYPFHGPSHLSRGDMVRY